MNYLRLKKQADFQKLFTKGRRAFSPSLTMIYFPSKETRMGISVGKRHGKSVKRNRIKRLADEVEEQHRQERRGKPERNFAALRHLPRGCSFAIPPRSS